MKPDKILLGSIYFSPPVSADLTKPIETNFKELQKGLNLISGRKFEIVIKKNPVFILEMANVTFETDRKVLLPDIILDNPEGIETGLLANNAFKSAIEFFYANKGKAILVAGHTDTSGSESHNDELSAERAISVLLFLAGDKISWARHGFAMHSPDDIQIILIWAYTEFGYNCKIEEINSDVFRESDKEALKGFRKGFFQQFGSILYEEQDLEIGEPSEVDFAAFYYLYDFKLAETMGISKPELQRKKDGLNFSDPAGVGCGENFPVDFIDLKGAEEDRQNRRVDILFFDEDEEVDLNTSPPAKAIYADGVFELHSINSENRAIKKEQDELIIQHRKNEFTPLANVPYRFFINGSQVMAGTTDSKGELLVKITEGKLFEIEFDSANPALKVELPITDLKDFNEPLIVQSEKSNTIEILEFQDVLFRTNSCVPMPEGENPDTTGHTSLTSVGLIATSLRYVEKFQVAKKLLIAGHTDTTGQDEFNVTLSNERAQNILALLEGNRALFKTLCHNRHLISDYKQILSWCSKEFSHLGFNCNPGQIDENEFAGIEPIKEFQRAYNINFNTVKREESIILDVDGSMGEDTWGAIFDMYEIALQKEMDESIEIINNIRNEINYMNSNIKTIGFGEYHPIEESERDNFKSLKNRRVEILYFDSNENINLEEVETNPSGDEIYGNDELIRTPIQPPESAKVPGTLRVMTGIREEFVQKTNLVYRLTSQSINQILDPKVEGVSSDQEVDVIFQNLDKKETYTLKSINSTTNDSDIIFQNIPFPQITNLFSA